MTLRDFSTVSANPTEPPCQPSSRISTPSSPYQIVRLVMRFPKLRRNQRWIVALAVVALLAVTAATLLLRSNTLSGKTEEQPRTVNVDQIARLTREGDIRSLSLNGDVVTAQLADSSIVVSRKESQVSILDILRSYGVPDSSLQQISLEVKDPLAALSLIHISEPTRLGMISYAVFCLKKKK